MSPASRIFIATLSMVMVTLLSAMSPMLTLLVADWLWPVLENLATRSARLRCHVSGGADLFALFTKET